MADIIITVAQIILSVFVLILLAGLGISLYFYIWHKWNKMGV